MGVVEGPDGRRVTLAERTVVGRSSSCLIRIDNAEVSGTHALLSWTGVQWCIRDLHSTNGTYVKSTRISDRRTLIRAGERLGFANDEWRLVSDAAPIVRAVNAKGEALEEDREGVLVLENNPGLIVVMPEGDGWLLHTDAAPAVAVHDQEEIDVLGSKWVLELPPPPDTEESTVRGSQSLLLTDVALTFHVSRDCEHVSMDLVSDAGRTSLPTRSHQKVLLVLARERLNDVGRGIPESEAGWMYVDDLLRACRMDRLRVNVEVQRARKALEQQGVLRSLDIVQRRLDTQQLRIGVSRLEITS